MITKEIIENLAQLARIDLVEEEKESLQKDLEKILGYVSELENASSGEITQTALVKNIMRDDSEPHESGQYTDSILAEAPQTVNGFIKVKKILG